jgi:hypothetical protein
MLRQFIPFKMAAGDDGLTDIDAVDRDAAVAAAEESWASRERLKVKRMPERQAHAK